MAAAAHTTRGVPHGGQTLGQNQAGKDEHFAVYALKASSIASAMFLMSVGLGSIIKQT